MYNVDIILDVSAKDSMQTVTAKQHDGLRTLTAGFTMDGVPMNLNVGDNFKLRVLDDQNLQHIINGTVDAVNETVTFDLTDAIQIHGKTIAECAYYNSSAQVLSSTVFCLNVIPDTTPGNYVTEETLRTETLRGLRREPTLVVKWDNDTGAATSAYTNFSKDTNGNPFLVKNMFSIYFSFSEGASAGGSIPIKNQDGDFVSNLNGALNTASPRYYFATALFDGYQWRTFMSASMNAKTSIANMQAQYDASGSSDTARNGISTFSLGPGIPRNTTLWIYGENYAGLL